MTASRSLSTWMLLSRRQAKYAVPKWIKEGVPLPECRARLMSKGWSKEQALTIVRASKSARVKFERGRRQ